MCGLFQEVRQGTRDKGQGARDKGQHYRQHLLISFICLYDGAIIDGALGDLLKGFIVKHLCLVTPCSARNALIENTYSLSANCSPRGGQGAKPPTPSIPPRGGSADSPVRIMDNHCSAIVHCCNANAYGGLPPAHCCQRFVAVPMQPFWELEGLQAEG